jgi:transcriptional regulator with XRE-family HTH domain
MSEKIPGNLIRAARELLGWSQRDLADKANCGLVTVQRIEKGGALHVEGTRDKIIDAIQKAGIRFIPQTESEGAGMRWASPSDQPPEPAAKPRSEKKFPRKPY